jgi:hypothetical protein
VLWIRLRFLLYALILAFLSVKLLGATEDTGADVKLEDLRGEPQTLGGHMRLSTSDGRVQRVELLIALPCDGAGLYWWRWSMGTAQLQQRGSRVSARTFDHSARGESPPWHFHGLLTGTLTDGGERASGRVQMTLSFGEPGDQPVVCHTDEGEYWEASTR